MLASSRNRQPTFTFRSSEAGSTFRCKVDLRAWARCRSPYRPVVRVGQHVFKVRAVDAAGNVDPTPASYGWRRLRPLPR